MSECKFIREQLQAMVWSALPPDEVVDLRRHVDECAGCKKELSNWQAFYAMTQTAKTPHRDEMFWETYQKTFAQKLDNLQRAPKPERSRLWSWLDFRIRPAYTFAVIILAVGIGLYIRFYTPGTTTQIANNMAQENWADFYVKEFDDVAKDEVLVEPLPVNYRGE